MDGYAIHVYHTEHVVITSYNFFLLQMQIVTVQHLKDYLKSQGRQIPAKANKQELVQIIQQIFQ